MKACCSDMYQRKKSFISHQVTIRYCEAVIEVAGIQKKLSPSGLDSYRFQFGCTISYYGQRRIKGLKFLF